MTSKKGEAKMVIRDEKWYTKNHTPIEDCSVGAICDINHTPQIGHVGNIVENFNTENFVECVLTDTDEYEYMGRLMSGEDAIGIKEIVDKIRIPTDLMAHLKCIVIYNSDKTVRTATGVDDYSREAVIKLYNTLVDEIASAQALYEYSKIK
jgi:hypothetical protein